MVIVVSSVNRLVSLSLIVIEILAHTDAMEELDILYIYHLVAITSPADRPDSCRSVPPIGFADSTPSYRCACTPTMPVSRKQR